MTPSISINITCCIASLVNFIAFAMKLVILALLSANFAESHIAEHNSASAVITHSFNEITGPGEYVYEVHTSDDQLRGERRTMYNAGTDRESVVVEGYYSYFGPDGLRYSVGYTADENGFHPEGEHLPTSADVERRPPQIGISLTTPMKPPIHPNLLKTLLGNQG